jgi:hypothetical protein
MVRERVLKVGKAYSAVIQIRSANHQSKPDAKNPASFRIRGWLLVAHPSYKLSQ